MRSFFAIVALASTTIASGSLPEYVISKNGKDWDYPYGTCQTGKEQSPIALKTGNGTTYRENSIKMESYPNSKTFRGQVDSKDDFSWQVEIAAADQATAKLTLNQDSTEFVYYPAQLHFHSPSENSIDNDLKDAEVHIVHTNAAGEYAVVGVLFEVDATAAATENVFLKSLFDAKKDTAGTVDVEFTNFIASLDLNNTWQFAGSLTTPPCTEGLKWTVLKDVQKITQAQLDSFQDLYEASTLATAGNNRVRQQLNDRILYQSFNREAVPAFVAPPIDYDAATIENNNTNLTDVKDSAMTLASVAAFTAVSALAF